MFQQQERETFEKRVEIDIQAQLAEGKGQAMDGVKGLAKPFMFLEQNRNWPLRRTAKCKKSGTLAVYCEPEGRRPIH